MNRVSKKNIIRAAALVTIGMLVTGLFLLNGALGGKTLDKTVLDRYHSSSLKAEEPGEALQLSEEYTKVGESDTLQLWLNSNDYSFKIIDKRNQFAWSTKVAEEYHTAKIANKLLKRALKQMFQLNVVNQNNESEIVNNIVADNEVQVHALKNGVMLRYYFNDYQIGLDIHVWLDRDAMNVLVPDKGIKEEGEYTITSLDMLPMLGASRSDEPGYIVYPDGSGAKYSFGSNLEKKPSPYINDVYAQSTYHLDLQEEQKNTEMKNIRIPAFGVVRKQNAFTGYIVDGDGSATIRIAPSGNVYSLDRVYSSMVYRKSYSYLSPDNKEIIELEKNRRSGDYGIRYMFTYNSVEASYGDLAKAIREFLIESGRMPADKTSSGTPTLNISFLMGAMEKSLLYETYVPMTTYDEATDILKEISEKSNCGISTILYGWQKRGFNSNPTANSPARAIGGKSGEKAFFAWLKAKGMTGFANANYVYADKGAPGYSSIDDPARDAMGLPITNEDEDLFVLSPLKLFERFTKDWVKEFRKREVPGLALDEMGNILYDDYNKKTDMTRRDTMAAWKGIAGTAKEQLGSVAVQGANAYMLAHADYVYDLPDSDSNHPLFSESIPFYQMILHGYIPYTSQISGNMAYDFEYQKLKWIEFGSIPSFVLTDKNTNLLKNSKASELFSSQYAVFKDKILSLADEYAQRLSDIGNSEMVYHKRTGDMVKIIYANGKEILINYGREETEFQGQRIGAMDYLVKEAEA